MPPFSAKPTFVIVAGAAYNPAHYGLLMHLLLEAGYPVMTGTLPSIGNNGKVTVEDDTKYVREQLLLPILDQEEHNVILACHSYGGLPGSAAALGLGTANRLKAGKKTSILGQIHMASILSPGGVTIVNAFGGQAPPHMILDKSSNLISCPDIVPPLLHDVKPASMADAAAASTVCFSLNTFTSPLPPASWATSEYTGTCAYIKCLDDRSVPLQAQEMMLAGSGREWILREINSSHSPQLSHLHETARIFMQLAQEIEGMKGGVTT